MLPLHFQFVLGPFLACCFFSLLPSFHIDSWDSLFLIYAPLNWHYFPYPLTALLSPPSFYTQAAHWDYQSCPLSQHFQLIISYLQTTISGGGCVTLASDVKFREDGGTCTSAPVFCSKCGCHEPWTTLCVCVCVCANMRNALGRAGRKAC